MKQLKFDSGPKVTLTIASKTNTLAATIRYDDEKDISEGETIGCLDASTGERLGDAEVEHVEMVPVREALDVVRLHWAEYSVQSVDELVSVLNDYYDDTIDLATEVKVLILNPDIDIPTADRL